MSHAMKPRAHDRTDRYAEATEREAARRRVLERVQVAVNPSAWVALRSMEARGL